MYISGFLKLHVRVEMKDALRYKLQILGIPIIVLSNVLCDNNLFILNVTKVKSMLKKKYLFVAYHKKHGSCARGTIRITYEPME